MHAFAYFIAYRISVGACRAVDSVAAKAGLTAPFFHQNKTTKLYYYMAINHTYRLTNNTRLLLY